LEISFEFEVDDVYLSHDVLHLADGGVLHDRIQLLVEGVAPTFETSAGLE
jgi:hypothetical protein